MKCVITFVIHHKIEIREKSECKSHDSQDFASYIRSKKDTLCDVSVQIFVSLQYEVK